MEILLEVFAHLSSSPRSLPFVQRVRVRKTVQRRIMTFEKKKQPVSREGMPAIRTIGTLQT
jgi:hypothetical protein